MFLFNRVSISSKKEFFLKKEIVYLYHVFYCRCFSSETAMLEACLASEESPAPAPAAAVASVASAEAEKMTTT